MARKTWPCSDKKKFNSSREAHIALDTIIKTSLRDTKPCRPYKCDCGFWHLTSQKKK